MSGAGVYIRYSYAIMEIGFSLGSNKGDRLQNLSGAKRLLIHDEIDRLEAASPLYETEPVEVKAEYKELKFLNGVVVVESEKPIGTWMEIISDIEERLGRVRSEDRNTPRPIDVDILYAGDLFIDDGGITVPHPRWLERRFVVQPLADIRPDLVMPGARKSVKEVLSSLETDETVTYFTDAW